MTNKPHASTLDCTAFCNMRLAQARIKQQKRVVTVSEQDGIYVQRGGKRLLSFCSNDYLGIAAELRSQPNLQVGAGASRLITGTHPRYSALEASLCAHKNTQAALVIGSGYLANIAAIPALMNAHDVIFMDRLSHACMIDGARISRARVMRYRHNDMSHLRDLLRKHRGQYQHALIATETVFSMDGDAAPMPEIMALAREHQCWVMTDDAHGLGIPDLPHNDADVQMGTLSKAAGVYGGYICGSQALIDMMVNYGSPFMFSTALPEVLLEAAQRSLHIMDTQKWRGGQVMKHAKRLCVALGLPSPSSPIIPIMIGDNERTMDAQKALEARDILVSAIRPPTVEKGKARLRISLSAAHTDAHIDALISALGEVIV